MPLLPAAHPDSVYYLAHSGGKDSQAMYAHVSRLVPHDRLIVMHADLGEVEWEGVQDHIRANIDHELHVVRANKTFLDLVRTRYQKRPHVVAWPSSRARQCTSDLKRDPLEKFIRNDMKTRGITQAVNAIGLRAQESAGRARRTPWRLNKRLSKAGRTVYEWLPILDWSTNKVFGQIAAVGQEPFWAYREGNTRLSCVFCILGCEGDLRNGRRHRPELYEMYRALERETGYTMFPKASLEERTQDTPPARAAGTCGRGPHSLQY